jgi:Ca2+-binding RTX toxin-like protein
MAVINGTNGNDRIIGTAQADTINGLGGSDRIIARTGGDTVNGGIGNDGLSGNGGSDTINGEAGRDLVQGDSGNDRLSGGTDDDRLLGDSLVLAKRGGNDLFQYSASGGGNDRILDFFDLAAENSPGAGDLLDITNASEAQLEAVYGNRVYVGDPGVSQASNDLVVNFGATSLGNGILTIDDAVSTFAGDNGLIVGTDIV